MDEYFSAWFPLPSCVLPGIAHRANNFVRGVYEKKSTFRQDDKHHIRDIYGPRCHFAY